MLSHRSKRLASSDASTNGGGLTDDEYSSDELDEKRVSSHPLHKQKKLRAQQQNTQAVKQPKHKVLVLSSRGIVSRYRHLMNDFIKLLPHSKKDSKLDRKDHLHVLNEVCEMRSCDTCMFFECRKQKDLYLWLSRCPDGPSAKFHVQNLHTMDEMKLTGNCLMGSRPLVTFDAEFDATPHRKLLKELLSQIFSTPKDHPKSKPFIDHVLSFYVDGDRIWFRNYQIIKPAEGPKKEQPTLVEIGPRCVMTLVRVFAGSFSGSTIYANATYITPNRVRADLKRGQAMKFAQRTEQEKQRKKKQKALAPHLLDEDSEISDFFEDE